MGVLQRWRDERALKTAADSYTARAWAEPADDDVRWLAALATAGDEDHARWELRYARRALALLAAERDALDDRTGSAVSRAIVERAARDTAVAPERRRVAERQFNIRLGRFRESLRERGGTGLVDRWASVLVETASGGRVGADARAAEVVQRLWDESHAALRELFGVAELPEHVRPSQAANARQP